jgi:hypothetical protein
VPPNAAAPALVAATADDDEASKAAAQLQAAVQFGALLVQRNALSPTLNWFVPTFA